MKLYFSVLLSCFILSCNSCVKTDKSKAIFIEKKSKEIFSEVDYNIILNNKTVEGIRVETINIGTIHISSGKLVATDPLISASAKALDITVPKGNYPIMLYQALTKDAGPRIALACLELTKSKPIKWILTVEDSTDTSVLTEGEYFGFGVDSGLAGLYDYQAGKELDAFDTKYFKEHHGSNIYDDFFDAEFKKNSKNQSDPQDRSEWINFKLPDSDLNITMFSSGYGDGVYPVYKGIDAKGKICCVIIDFLVLLHPEEK
jgi:hypothetical protein